MLALSRLRPSLPPALLQRRRQRGPVVVVVVVAASSSSSSSAPRRRPPPNPPPARPQRGRREPPAPLLDFEEDDDGDGDEKVDGENDDNNDGTAAPTSARRQRRRAQLEAAYLRVVSSPSHARDADVRLYFKKRRLLAERAEAEDGEEGGGRGRRAPPLARSWVDDNDALPRPGTALKLSAEARAQVIGERAGALARALGWEGGDDDGGDDEADQDDEHESPLPRLCASLLSRHPGLLARPTSELAASARGHARSARLSQESVLRLAVEAPRLLLAHPDAAEARAGLLGRALVVAPGGGAARRAAAAGVASPPPPSALPSALLWRYPSALGTARARPLVEWAEALAAAVCRAQGASEEDERQRRRPTDRERGPAARGPRRAGAPGAGVAEALAVLAAGVDLLLRRRRRRERERERNDDDDDDDDEADEAADRSGPDRRREGDARDAWLQRSGPEAAAAAVAALAADLLLRPPAAAAAAAAPATASPPLPLMPLLRAEPALLLSPGDPLREEARRRLGAALRALERLFAEEEGEEEGGGGSATAARRAVLLAPRLLRAIPGGEGDAAALAALREALRGLSATEWLFGGAAGTGTRRRRSSGQEAARRHPRLLLAALQAPSAAMDARADRLARALDVPVAEVKRAARADPSLLAAPPALVKRALLALARGLSVADGNGDQEDGDPAAAALAASRALWSALAADGGAPACAGAWASAARGWLPLQLRALCACLRLPARRVRRLLLWPPPSPSPSPSPPALAALCASPAELREGHARLTAAIRRLAARRRRHRQQQQQQASSMLPPPPPLLLAEARLASALLERAPALAAAALSPALNAAAVAALDACEAGAPMGDDDDGVVVEAVRAAMLEAASCM